MVRSRRTAALLINSALGRRHTQNPAGKFSHSCPLPCPVANISSHASKHPATHHHHHISKHGAAAAVAELVLTAAFLVGGRRLLSALLLRTNTLSLLKERWILFVRLFVMLAVSPPAGVATECSLLRHESANVRW